MKLFNYVNKYLWPFLLPKVFSLFFIIDLLYAGIFVISRSSVFNFSENLATLVFLYTYRHKVLPLLDFIEFIKKLVMVF